MKCTASSIVIPSYVKFANLTSFVKNSNRFDFVMISELQSRLAGRLFTGKHKLPSVDSMKEWIIKQRSHTRNERMENLW